VSEFRINISKLSEGVHTYSLEAGSAELGLGEPFTDKVRVRAVLEKSSRQLFLSVELTAKGQFTCDRCLNDFCKDLRGKYSIVYVTKADKATGLKNEEVQTIGPALNSIDLDEDVRQSAVLAIPQKLLCKESCAGLCPKCGIDKNSATCTCSQEEVDPRWEALQKISKN
jgi:uncharacterized protein